MSFTILTKYPLWFVVFCVLLAALLTFLLYKSDKKFKSLKRWQLYMMQFFRFSAIFLIAFLLLSPMVRTISKTIEKPVVIIAQDNSESVVINRDSTYYLNEYPQAINKLEEQLSERFDVYKYEFGAQTQQGISWSFSDKHTNITNLLKSIETNFVNRNVGALLIASDGIYNQGVNPVFGSRNMAFPLYSIALGDTNRHKDFAIDQVKSNRIAFLGNMFPLQATVNVEELKGVETTFRLLHKGKELFSKTVVATKQSYTEEIMIEVEATETGIQQYRMEIIPHKDEMNTTNNYKTIVIDVIDSKQKILMLTNGPHPDVGAIHKTLVENQNYDIEYYAIDEFKKVNELKKYNLIVLHQLPSEQNSAVGLFSNLMKTDIPLLFILGGQSDLQKFNSLNLGFSILHKKNAFDNSRATINEQFTVFELNENFNRFAALAPPLLTAFGQYKTPASANVLAFQKIKSVATTNPLIFFDTQNGRKTGYITGEGIWRWRLHDFLENSNHNNFNLLINKTVQYLALRINKERFVVETKKVFAEKEPIAMQAEVYNKAFEQITTAEVKLEITNEEGNVFEFMFDTNQSQMYTLNAGTFPVGQYSYKATAKSGSDMRTKEGKFIVMPINEEARITTANHNLMYQLASQNGGSLYYPKQLDSLTNVLLQSDSILAKAYIEKNLQDMINLKWLFFAILTFLSAEWFFRKFYGGY